MERLTMTRAFRYATALTLLRLTACVGQPAGAVEAYCQWSDAYGAPVPAVHLMPGTAATITAICEATNDGFTGVTFTAKRVEAATGVTVTFASQQISPLPGSSAATFAASTDAQQGGFEICATPIGLSKGHVAVDTCQTMRVVITTPN